MSSVKIHTRRDDTWKDASGLSVPFSYITKTDLKKEALACSIWKEALAVETALQRLHTSMSMAFDEVRKQMAKEYEIKGKTLRGQKGGFTWYNFDKSLRIEASVDEVVRFDEAMMSQAKELIDEFLLSGIETDAQSIIKEIVSGAFATTRGQVDTRKVFQLLKWESKVKDKRFVEACNLMREAQSTDKTRLYMRVWERDEAGQYRNINLNFSSL